MRRPMEGDAVADTRRVLERIEHDAAADARPCPICGSYLLLLTETTETIFVHFDDCELGAALGRTKIGRRKG